MISFLDRHELARRDGTKVKPPSGRLVPMLRCVQPAPIHAPLLEHFPRKGAPRDWLAVRRHQGVFFLSVFFSRTRGLHLAKDRKRRVRKRHAVLTTPARHVLSSLRPLRRGSVRMTGPKKQGQNNRPDNSPSDPGDVGVYGLPFEDSLVEGHPTILTPLQRRHCSTARSGRL